MPRSGDAAFDFSQAWRARLLTTVAAVLVVLGSPTLVNVYRGLADRPDAGVFANLAGFVLLFAAVPPALPYAWRAASLCAGLQVFGASRLGASFGLNMFVTMTAAILMARIFLDRRATVVAAAAAAAVFGSRLWQMDWARQVLQRPSISNLLIFAAGTGGMTWALAHVYGRLRATRDGTRLLVVDLERQAARRRAVAGRIRAVEDEERQRLAQVLSTDVGGGLTHALELLDRAMGADVAGAGLRVGPVARRLTDLLAQVEAASRSLLAPSPPPPSSKSLTGDDPAAPALAPPQAARSDAGHAPFLVAARGLFAGCGLLIAGSLMSHQWLSAELERHTVVMVCFALLAPVAFGLATSPAWRYVVVAIPAVLGLGSMYDGYLALAGALLCASVLLALMAGGTRPAFVVLAAVLLLVTEAVLWGTVLGTPVLPMGAGIEVGRARLWRSVAFAVAGVTGLILAVDRSMGDLERSDTEARRLFARLQAEVSARVAAGVRLAHAADTERRRIGGELRDEVGRPLAEVVERLRVAELSGTRDALTTRLSEVRTRLHAIRHRVSALSGDLRPTVLTELGLPAALRWLVEGEAARRGLIADVRIDPGPLHLPDHAELVVFRAVQECLANAVTHARAGHVSLSVDAQAGGTRFAFDDDGVGFDVDAVLDRADSAHGGLTRLREQLQSLGAEVQIRSRANLGTVVGFVLPPASAVEGPA